LIGYHTTVSPVPEPTRRDGTRVCSIADALELVGERWSFLVVREVGLGVRRFNDIQRNTGSPREMLTARLRRLEEAGILTRSRYREHPPRYDYELTEAGRALIPILRDLRSWGERFDTPRLGRGRAGAADLGAPPALQALRDSAPSSTDGPIK
jgi:DNA-binding HxlR family transcriptional regulator